MHQFLQETKQYLDYFVFNASDRKENIPIFIFVGKQLAQIQIFGLVFKHNLDNPEAFQINIQSIQSLRYVILEDLQKKNFVPKLKNVQTMYNYLKQKKQKKIWIKDDKQEKISRLYLQYPVIGKLEDRKIYNMTFQKQQSKLKFFLSRKKIFQHICQQFHKLSGQIELERIKNNSIKWQNNSNQVPFSQEYKSPKQQVNQYGQVWNNNFQKQNLNNAIHQHSQKIINIQRKCIDFNSDKNNAVLSEFDNNSIQSDIEMQQGEQYNQQRYCISNEENIEHQNQKQVFMNNRQQVSIIQEKQEGQQSQKQSPFERQSGQISAPFNYQNLNDERQLYLCPQNPSNQNSYNQSSSIKEMKYHIQSQTSYDQLNKHYSFNDPDNQYQFSSKYSKHTSRYSQTQNLSQDNYIKVNKQIRQKDIDNVLYGQNSSESTDQLNQLLQKEYIIDLQLKNQRLTDKILQLQFQLIKKNIRISIYENQQNESKTVEIYKKLNQFQVKYGSKLKILASTLSLLKIKFDELQKEFMSYQNKQKPNSSLNEQKNSNKITKMLFYQLVNSNETRSIKDGPQLLIQEHKLQNIELVNSQIQFVQNISFQNKNLFQPKEQCCNEIVGFNTIVQGKQDGKKCDNQKRCQKIANIFQQIKQILKQNKHQKI